MEQNCLSIISEIISFRLLGYRVTLKLSKYSPTKSTASKRACNRRDSFFQYYPGQDMKLKAQVNKECNMISSNCHQVQKETAKETEAVCETRSTKGQEASEMSISAMASLPSPIFLCEDQEVSPQNIPQKGGKVRPSIGYLGLSKIKTKIFII